MQQRSSSSKVAVLWNLYHTKPLSWEKMYPHKQHTATQSHFFSYSLQLFTINATEHMFDKKHLLRRDEVSSFFLCGCTQNSYTLLHGYPLAGFSVYSSNCWHNSPIALGEGTAIKDYFKGLSLCPPVRGINFLVESNESQSTVLNYVSQAHKPSQSPALHKLAKLGRSQTPEAPG